MVHVGQADFLAGEYNNGECRSATAHLWWAIQEILAGNCLDTYPAILGATNACRTAKDAYIRVALAENRSFNL